MSRNPYGVGIDAQEWGSKARKEEARIRGLSHKADRIAIAEGLDEIFAEHLDEEFPDDTDDGPEALSWYDEWAFEAAMRRFDYEEDGGF